MTDWWKNPAKNNNNVPKHEGKDDVYRATVSVIDEDQDLYLMTFPNGEECQIILEFEFEFELEDDDSEE